jgi:hypothetical protein
MRALGAMGDAASLDDMAKQAEISKIEPHMHLFPSDSTKSAFA